MPRAERDLAYIFSNIEARTSDTARIWYLGLKESILRLRDSPRRSPVTPENDELRHLLYGHKPDVYRVIYRILEKPRIVEVLHIRHGAMDKFEKRQR
jgi:plasmid stabilization system protein ParE